MIIYLLYLFIFLLLLSILLILHLKLWNRVLQFCYIRTPCLFDKFSHIDAILMLVAKRFFFLS